MNYISIKEFQNKRGYTLQKIYRWIREGKIKSEDYKIEEKIVKRLVINDELILEKNGEDR